MRLWIFELVASPRSVSQHETADSVTAGSQWRAPGRAPLPVGDLRAASGQPHRRVGVSGPDKEVLPGRLHGRQLTGSCPPGEPPTATLISLIAASNNLITLNRSSSLLTAVSPDTESQRQLPARRPAAAAPTDTYP